MPHVVRDLDLSLMKVSSPDFVYNLHVLCRYTKNCLWTSSERVCSTRRRGLLHLVWSLRRDMLRRLLPVQFGGAVHLGPRIKSLVLKSPGFIPHLYPDLSNHPIDSPLGMHIQVDCMHALINWVQVAKVQPGHCRASIEIGEGSIAVIGADGLCSGVEGRYQLCARVDNTIDMGYWSYLVVNIAGRKPASR